MLGYCLNVFTHVPFHLTFMTAWLSHDIIVEVTFFPNRKAKLREFKQLTQRHEAKQW